MLHTIPFFDRRALLLGGAGMAMTGSLPPMAQVATLSTSPPENGTANRGDFDFLTGEWTIKIRKFDTSGPSGNLVRDASATVHRVLDGMGSIEELRNGDGSMWGMGVRLLHSDDGLWADHWTSAANGVVNPPQLGTFSGGKGIFLADDMDGETPVKICAVWDQITPTSCRWYQAMSRDGGVTWETDWYMDWTRAP